MRAFAQYIMRGRIQAMLVAVAAAMLSLLIPPVNYVSGAVVGLVTLRRGWQEGLIIIAGAGVVMALLALTVSLEPVFTTVFAAAVWLPVWVLALVLRHTVSLSMTLTVAAITGGVMVVLGYLAVEDPAQAWRDVIERLIEQAQEHGEFTAADSLGQTLLDAAPHMTGMLMAALVVGVMFSLLVARAWQAMLYNPGGFRQEFHALRLGKNFALATIVVLLAGMIGSGWSSEVASNIAIVVMAAYLLHGVSLMHGVMAITGAHTGWLVALYSVVFLLLPWLSLLLAAIAFADSWTDIRGRLRKNGQIGNGT